MIITKAGCLGKGVRPITEVDKRLIYGKLKINLEGRTVFIDECEVKLTKMEYDTLCFLASNPDIAFTRERIYEAVCQEDYSGGAYIITDIIYRLRTKLKITNIHTLHGYGYKFSTDNGEDITMS